jgi:polyphenol oxidase
MASFVFMEKNGLPLIMIPEWSAEGVDMCFTTRRGGCSSGAYSTMNLGLHVSDGPGAVLENRTRLVAAFGGELRDAVSCEQIHGAEVCRITSADRGKGMFALESALPGFDAMITDQPGLFMLSFYADCVPVYFYDPTHRVIGLAHCGWKGTMGRIAVRTLSALRESFGTDPNQIKVFVGPGIGPCCFVIQPELAEKVKAEFDWGPEMIVEHESGIITWDLQETNHRLLAGCGVDPENISVCRLCTVCRADLFYSYRRDHGTTGRMGALLSLRY